MQNILKTHDCFRKVLGCLSIDELVTNKQLVKKAERIQSLFIELISKEEK